MAEDERPANLQRYQGEDDQGGLGCQRRRLAAASYFRHLQERKVGRMKIVQFVSFSISLMKSSECKKIEIEEKKKHSTYVCTIILMLVSSKDLRTFLVRFYFILSLSYNICVVQIIKVEKK